MTDPISVTLFSGVGGSSKALRDLGHTVFCYDFNEDAVASLRANGFIASQADVSKMNWAVAKGVFDLSGGVKVLEGGPPCQPFSQSHDGDGQYDPRDMIPEFLRAIDGLQPELFVMEEVQTLTWARHRDYFNRVISDMEALGYQVDWQILNAADYGIGQARKRLIVVGKRLDLLDEPGDLDEIRWPTKVPDWARITMADALKWDDDTAWERNQAVPDPRAHVSAPEDVAWPYLRPAPTVVGSFRPEVAAAPGYRRAGDPPRQATPGSVVTTLEERLVLQDFPTDWVVCGNEASRALQVGNSVPVGMMRRVIEANL